MQPSRTIRLSDVCVSGVCLLAALSLVSSPTFAQIAVDTRGATQPAAVDPPPGVLLAVEGDVSSIRGPRIEPASGGMPLDLREGLETGSGGALIVWNDAIVIAVGDNTSLHAISPHRFHLSRGRLVLLVPPARPDAPQPIGTTSPIVTIESGSLVSGRRASGAVEGSAVESGAVESGAVHGSALNGEAVDARATRLEILQPGEYEIHVDGNEGDRQTMEAAVRIGRAVLGDAQRRMRLDPRESAKMRAGGKPRETLYWKKSHVTRFASVLARLRDIREGRTPLSAQYLPDALHAYAWLFDLYGSWYVDQEYGYYWVPRVADSWQPYGAGRWIYRHGYGWVWMDEAEWGWATQHYGRWTMDARGTWAWRPDNRWSGGWVRWEMVDEEIVWCALGWDDYPAYEYPYDRSRERYRGALPRRGWLSARPGREAHHIRPDPPGRWPAIDRPARPPAPPAGPPPPTDAPGLANVAMPRDRGTAVPRTGGAAEPRGGRAVARGGGDGAEGGVAVRRVEADAVDAGSETSVTSNVAIPRNPRPAALLGGTAIPRQPPTASGVSLSTVARDAPSAAALHEQGSRTPARSPQRAQGSGGSDVSTTGAATSTGTIDRNREAWDRYQAELDRQRSRDSYDGGRSSTPARSPQRARDSSDAERSSGTSGASAGDSPVAIPRASRAPSGDSTPRPDPTPDPTPDPSPTPPPVAPSEPEPAPTPPPEPAPAPPPEPTPTPTPTPSPAPAPEPPPPAPQARPRDPDPDPPSRAVPRDPDESHGAPSRRPPDEPASSGPRRRHP